MVGTSTAKKLNCPSTKNLEKELDLRYTLIELNIICELEDFSEPKDDILRTLCATEYAVYFYMSITINERSTRAIINSGASGNFILFRIIKKFKLFK